MGTTRRGGLGLRQRQLISSDRGSLPEVAGDLVVYVDPWNPRAWANQIYRMATDDPWRLEWEQRAKTKYHLKTWAESAASVDPILKASFL